jgi:branched-chain amino acid aminotransferase
MVPCGEGVFETLKVVDSRPHALTRHLARLSSSAAVLGLESPSQRDIEREVEAHLRAHPLPLGRLRIIWAAGRSGPVLSIDAEPTARPTSAISLALTSWQVDRSSPLRGLKTTAYVDYSMATREARSAGFDDALLANNAGDLCETATANVFYVLDGVLFTPPESTGCLPGIARALITELCDVVEETAPTSVLEQASEVFVTSSLREVQSVARIGGRSYRTDGPVTAAVMAEWRRGTTACWNPPPPG